MERGFQQTVQSVPVHVDWPIRAAFMPGMGAVFKLAFAEPVAMATFGDGLLAPEPDILL